MELVRFAVGVDVMPRDGISDPQGQTIERALPSLGFADVHDVRVGKRIELVVEAADPGTADILFAGTRHGFGKGDHPQAAKPGMFVQCRDIGGA